MSQAVHRRFNSRRALRAVLRQRLRCGLYRWLSSGLVLLLTCPFPVSHLTARAATPQSTDKPLTLEVGRRIERDIVGGQTHTYLFTLAVGQFIEIIVEQRGIDVVESLFAPSGDRLLETTLVTRTQGDEWLYAVVEAAGTYRIEVRAKAENAAAGRYAIRVETIREATATDRHRAEALKLYRQADHLLDKQTVEARRDGVEHATRSLQLWQALGDPFWQGELLNLLGVFSSRLGDIRQALDYFTQAIPPRQSAGDRLGEAFTTTNLGNMHYLSGDVRKAVEHWAAALPLFRAVGEKTGEAFALNGLAVGASEFSEYAKAFDYYDQALAIWQALDNRKEEATVLSNIGLLYDSTGEKHKALDYYQRSLTIRRHLRDLDGEALTLNNFAKTYNDLGQRQKALDHYQQALGIYESTSNHAQQGFVLNNLGAVYWVLGDYQKAIDFYQRALPLIQKGGNRATEALLRNNLGRVYADLGSHQKAIDQFHQSLAMWKSLANPRGQALVLSNLGTVYRSMNDNPKALDLFQQALALRRAGGDRGEEAVPLHNIGTTHFAAGDMEKAAAAFEEALQIARIFKDPRVEAQTLFRLAQLEGRRGNLALARQRVASSIDIAERLRSAVTIQQLRATYFASVRRFYDFYIDVLMRLHKEQPGKGFDTLALETSERARARNLLEALGEVNADIRQGVDLELIKRESELQQKLNIRAAAQMRLLTGKHTPEQAQAVATEIERLTTEFQFVQAQIRQTSPRYAALTQPATLSLAEIQRRVLDDETILLEYALGDERSYLWAVTTGSIQSFELPGRDTLTTLALRLIDLVTARNKAAPNESIAQRQERLARAETEYTQVAAQLSQALLGPVASRLEKRRLLIVSEGALQYVPFAALPLPETRRGGDAATRREVVNPRVPASPRPRVGTVPLIAEHEVVRMPSVSTLAVLRREVEGRTVAAKTIAVFADPVFSVDDARFQMPKATAQAARPKATTAGRSPAVPLDETVRLPRLPLTRLEADAIAALVPEAERKQALGFEANRATATASDLSAYRYIHFATHGLLDDAHPELSGVALSAIDEQGRAQDGFLRLHEIYNLSLPAEMVVLSACETALGKDIRGEGLVGLTRGFMYAGAKRVVASLWKIDDRATAELMKRFYAGVLGDRKLRPAVALREAQLAMWQSNRWRAPYYWAAFILQGEWR